MTEFNQDHGSSMDVQPRTPAMVTLYDPSGNMLQVPTAQEGYWISQGMRRTQYHLADCAQRMPALFDAARQAVDAFIRGVQDDGYIDPGDQAQLITANVAIDMLTNGWADVREAAFGQFPMREAQPVRMHQIIENQDNRQEVEHRVDPNQVALQTEQLGLQS